MMSFKEFKAAKVAGPQQETKSKNSVLPSTSSTLSPSHSTQEELHLKMCKIFTFIDETYQDLRRFTLSLQKNLNGSQLMQTINKYKKGCNEIYAKALESYDMSHMLAQNIVRTMDIFKELCTCIMDLEEYNYRLCEIMSIFIVCELRLSVDAAQQEQLLKTHRIIYIMRRHLVQEDEQETLYNILRTLVYIPKFFNARDIMCAIFGEFIPIKPVLGVKVLPDKLYILYIIVFYRWMVMQKDNDDKMLILNFAESFMKPSVSLCSNNLYGAYLPMYSMHSTATRTILNNMKCYRDIRNACMIDNALKKIGAVVDLCDDEDDEDDIIIVDTSPTTEFVEIFATTRLEPLSSSMSKIKLEEKTVVSSVDLTEDEEPADPTKSINERHEKWLNEFQRLARQYRESKLLLEKQQNQLISNGEKEAVICLDSDSEEEEDNSTAVSKEVPAAATTLTQENNAEDLFVDNYPLTNTPLNCDSHLESLDAEDENDVTKISPRFLSGTLRTYQAKKSNLTEAEDKSNSDVDEHIKSRDMDKAYRRDSIHISFTPPERSQNEDDEGTDVQDEHDDSLDEEAETKNYSSLLTTNKITEKEIWPRQIRPMGPYPTYNNMNNGMTALSQTLSRNSEQQQYQDKQYHSDNTETKTSKKQKKKVQFNTSPLGPTVSSASPKPPLKPALQQPKYKASDALEYPHLRSFKRFSCTPSLTGSTSTSASNSTSSSIKQKEHIAAAATLFRNVLDKPRQSQPYPEPFSPSSSSLSSRSLTSPGTPTTTRKKSRPPKNKKPAIKQRRATMGTRDDMKNSLESTTKEECYSIIRNRAISKYDYHSSDDYYGEASDSDIITNERYKNDAKLRNGCTVVITPTKELIQYERKRDEMYNEILQKQRKQLELRALEKQREKERRRIERREEKREQTSMNSSEDAASGKMTKTGRRTRNYNEFFLSSESEYETHFHMRTRTHKQENFKELEPLNIQIETTEATTTTLLSKIDAHLDKSVSEKSNQFEVKEQQQENQTYINDINQHTCDISSDKGQTKLRELNLLADIAQHLSPYQLDLPANTNPARTSSPEPEPDPEQDPTSSAASQIQKDKDVPKEKVTVTEHLIIQSADNLQLNNNDQEQQVSTSYAHEPKLKNVAAIFKSSPCTNLLQSQNHNQIVECNDNPFLNNSTGREMNSKIQTDETLEQILEIVLKPITSPFNPLNECSSIRPQTQSDSTIPLLISSVESLNHFVKDDIVAIQKSDDKMHLFMKETTKENSENIVTENESLNKEAIERASDSRREQNSILNRNKPKVVLSSDFLNSVESSIMCAADLANTPNETEISQTLNGRPSLLSADLSDISLESEISKHLPDIAEPSPVVTDISENSNESEASNSFGLQNPIISNSTADTSVVTEMSIPDLSLVMSNIEPPPTLPTTQQESLENNFNQLNCSLNTPTKLADIMSRENGNISTGDLNTPLKFAVQPELQSNSMPLKNTLDQETDNNVTKFLDLILNKTVTDAESETRDEIIKELNALTTSDTATPPSEMLENGSKNETVPLESKLNAERSESGDPATCVEVNKNLNEKISDEAVNIFKEQTSLNKNNSKSQQILEYSFESHIENKTCSAEIADSKTNPKRPTVAETTSANNELNPPVETPREQQRSELFSEIATTEYSGSIPSISLNPNTKIKSPAISSKNVTQTLSANDEPSPPVETPKEESRRESLTEYSGSEPTISLSPTTNIKMPAIKQSFNIKCRVRLKRLNIDDHCKTTQKETWIAIPITTKPEEVVCSNNYVSKFDTLIETMPTIKKPCLKYNNKYAREEDKNSKNLIDVTTAANVLPIKRSKLDIEESSPIEVIQTPIAQEPQTLALAQATPPATASLIFNTTPSQKSKVKPLKTVKFDLSNLNEELRDNSTCNYKQRSKTHSGFYLKNSRPKKLPDNTLRAAETLQLFVNSINDSARTLPSAEFNKKRNPIKNKCIAEDETPRPPPASTLMGTPPCKKTCTEKSRSQIISSKCKDQLVSSLPTPSISSITSDISTARIYTSSPLDQTLPEYDDNVDTVADSELILPSTTGSLRRKLKRPKKSLTRSEPVDDISTDDISNQPECNAEDDTDAVADNEDDVFAEELLPIPAANEHILEEIVSARPSHIGTGTAIRDDYMNIEATATVPVYLFNDESRDLSTPEPIQSTDTTTNVVDSSSYLNNSSSITANKVVATTSAPTLAMGNLEKSMLSPSEHEVSSTQETFFQTPTKNKQTEIFGEKSSASKDQGNSDSGFMSCSISKQKPEDTNFQNKQTYQTSSTTGLLQNNQVDTTNHSPEMCTLAVTATTNTTNVSNNRKIRKASTHDEILFNELQQQQLPSNKRKAITATTFCAESTSDNNSNATSKTKIKSNNLEAVKLNGSLVKADDKFKKFLKEACKKDKNQIPNELNMSEVGACNNGGGGGSSPSTTTNINEEKLSKSKRKKMKSSKASKTKSHSERSSKIVLKASKLTPPQIPANPLILTITKSRLTRPPSSLGPPIAMEPQDEHQESEFLDIPNAKLFIEKNKETTAITVAAAAAGTAPIAVAAAQYNNHQHNHVTLSQPIMKSESNAAVVVASKFLKCSQSPVNAITEIVKKPNKIFGSERKDVIRIANSKTIPNEKSSSSALKTKKKEKLKTANNTNSLITICANANNNNIMFVKDKYDLIKSKDKHYHNHHDQQDVKEKSKDKSSSQSKAATPNNSRSHKNSTKEKIKGEKPKEKRKTTEKVSIQQQPDKVIQLNTSESRNKSLSSSSSFTATSSSTTSFSYSNTKQSNSKSSKNSSTSSSTSAILKSKVNLSTTQLSSSATAAETASSQLTTATPSTNNKKIFTS